MIRTIRPVAMLAALIGCGLCSCTRQFEEYAKNREAAQAAIKQGQAEIEELNRKLKAEAKLKEYEEKAKQATADIRSLEAAATAYRLQHPEIGWPSSLNELLKGDDQGNGPYVADKKWLVDPWGQPYQYDVKGPSNLA